MTRHSAPWILSLILVGAALAAALWWTGRAEGGRAGASVPTGVAVPATAISRGASAPAARLLRAWDRKRADAYARADVEALGALYAAGSPAGAADVKLLHRYRARGYHVAGMRMQVLAIDVLAHRPGRWRLRVTDRLDRAVAVGHGSRLRLPRDQATTRVIVLRRWGPGGWRVASVRA